MANLAKKQAITIGPLARCARHDITLPIYKDQCYNSWKYVPTIISDQDSDVIDVRNQDTSDLGCLRGKGAKQIVEMTSKTLGR